MATPKVMQALNRSLRLVVLRNFSVQEAHICSTRCISYSRAPYKRISVPKMIQEKLKKLEKRKITDSHKLDVDPKQVFVISCKNREKNHRIGQKYTPGVIEQEKIGYNFYERDRNLASYGWGHRKSQGDFFILNAYGGNPAVRSRQQDDVEAQHFDELELNPELVDCLARNKITKLTNIQKQSISKILEGGNILCAAETGSGKTLCYLVPVIQMILRQKEQLGGSTRGQNRPQAVIALPSHELVQQVYDVVQMFSESLPIKAVTVTGGQGSKRIYKTDVDLVIGTPGAIRKAILRREYNVNYVQTLVLDEGDTLLDSSFLHMTRFLIQQIGVRTEDISDVMTGTQCLIVCATKPRHLERTIGDILPLDTLSTLTSEHLHRLMPHVPQKFLRLQTSQKAGACLKLCKNAVSSHISTMVFCNRNNSCHWLHKFLHENDVPHLKLNGHVNPEERLKIVEKFQSGEHALLICTDIASRGLDTLRVQHVVNFEFPLFMSDYIHRVGRVGRVGSKKTGYVLNFITKIWEVALVWEIETAARKMAELNKVDADIKAVVNRIYEDKFGDEDRIDIGL